MRRCKVAGSLAAVVLAACSWCGDARAQSTLGPQAPASSVAEALFQEAKRLMAEERYADACPKLRESYRLEPGAGTLLNLAVCHEKEGRIATAWAEYNEALVENRRLGNHARVALAQRALADLEPRLPRLQIALASPEVQEELQFTLNDTPLSAVAFDVPIPVDPGRVVLVAAAPGYESWKRVVEVGEGQSLRVEVPPLRRAREPGRVSKATASEPLVPQSDGRRRTWGWVVGGAGIAAVGVGAFFGVSALDKEEASLRACSPVCGPDAVDTHRQAKNEALVADIAIGTGALATGIGLYLVLTGGSGAARDVRVDSHVGVRPYVSPSGRSVGLEGAW